MELPVIHNESELPTLQCEPGSNDTPRSRLCDCVGVVCSSACAINCAAIPFLIGWLPALGLSWLADEGFHQWMVGICFLMAVAAVIPGYRRHRRKLVPLLAIAGVSVLATGAFAVTDDCCQQGVAALDASADAVRDECCAAPQESNTPARNNTPDCCKHGEHQANQVTSATLASVMTLPNPSETTPSETTAESARPACCTDQPGCEDEVPQADGTSTALASAALSDVMQEQVNVATAGVAISGLPDNDASQANGWLDWLASLLTPLGGCLLVAAHLMNRRCCDCCEKPA